MRTLTETFEQYLERSEPYFATVREAGDLPWFEEPEKRAAVVARLGLPADIDPMELRRALWQRRNQLLINTEEATE